MSLQKDLQEVKDKVEALFSKVQSAEPTLAEKVFAAVEQELLSAGYVKPAETIETVAEPATEGAQ